MATDGGHRAPEGRLHPADRTDWVATGSRCGVVSEGAARHRADRLTGTSRGAQREGRATGSARVSDSTVGRTGGLPVGSVGPDGPVGETFGREGGGVGDPPEPTGIPRSRVHPGRRGALRGAGRRQETSPIRSGPRRGLQKSPDRSAVGAGSAGDRSAQSEPVRCSRRSVGPVRTRSGAELPPTKDPTDRPWEPVPAGALLATSVALAHESVAVILRSLPSFAVNTVRFSWLVGAALAMIQARLPRCSVR